MPEGMSSEAPSFCTAVTCIDGRVQLPVIEYLTQWFDVRFVDVVSEPGPAGILADDPESDVAASMYRRVDISVEAHSSQGLAVVAHHECYGHRKPRQSQLDDVRKSAAWLRRKYPDLPVLALWVGEQWTVTQVPHE